MNASKMFLLFPVVCFVLMTQAVGFADDSTHAVVVESREEVIRIFRHAIALNEERKGVAWANPSDLYSRKSRASSEYDELHLEPARDFCVKLLKAGNDVALMMEFSSLLLSFENSADEGFDWAVGEVFAINPEVVEKAFRDVSSSERAQLCERVGFGLLNYFWDKPRHPDRQDRLDRLERLGCTLRPEDRVP